MLASAPVSTMAQAGHLLIIMSTYCALYFFSLSSCFTIALHSPITPNCICPESCLISVASFSFHYCSMESRFSSLGHFYSHSAYTICCICSLFGLCLSLFIALSIGLLVIKLVNVIILRTWATNPWFGHDLPYLSHDCLTTPLLCIYHVFHA